MPDLLSRQQQSTLMSRRAYGLKPPPGATSTAEMDGNSAAVSEAQRMTD